MKTVAKKLYEAMFLVDSTEAASDWEGIIALIRHILERSDAEIDSIKKWDDYKLAYEIRQKGRGTYILCYFRAPGAKIQDIERDVKLSERIMRVLILSAEAMSKEDIEKETPAEQIAKRGQKTEEPIPELEVISAEELKKSLLEDVALEPAEPEGDIEQTGLG